MRLVEVPMVAGGPVFLNPDHVVQVTRHVRCGSQVVTPMGERLHVDLPIEELVERLSEDSVVVLNLRPNDGPSLQDSVRENLTR